MVFAAASSSCRPEMLTGQQLRYEPVIGSRLSVVAGDDFCGIHAGYEARRSARHEIRVSVASLRRPTTALRSCRPPASQSATPSLRTGT
jgi:hypothetical protein